MVLCYGSANRDDEMFDDPDVFDPRREHLGDHLAFGHGVHYCLGAVLARTEASTALQEIARRVESCMITADNDFRYNPSFVLRGLNTLRVHFVPDRSPQLNPQASWPV